MSKGLRRRSFVSFVSVEDEPEESDEGSLEADRGLLRCPVFDYLCRLRRRFPCFSSYFTAPSSSSSRTWECVSACRVPNCPLVGKSTWPPRSRGLCTPSEPTGRGSSWWWVGGGALLSPVPCCLGRFERWISNGELCYAAKALWTVPAWRVSSPWIVVAMDSTRTSDWTI